MLQRARQYLAETLPIAQQSLDTGQLADGKLALTPSRVIIAVQTRFAKKLPAMLTDHLSLASVDVSWHEIPYDPGHWMGIDQPRRLPIITINAIFKDREDRSIPLSDSIELLID